MIEDIFNTICIILVVASLLTLLDTHNRLDDKIVNLWKRIFRKK